jgi:hypothetical protein
MARREVKGCCRTDAWSIGNNVAFVAGKHRTRLAWNLCCLQNVGVTARLFWPGRRRDWRVWRCEPLSHPSTLCESPCYWSTPYPAFDAGVATEWKRRRRAARPSNPAVRKYTDTSTGFLWVCVGGHACVARGSGFESEKE